MKRPSARFLVTLAITLVMLSLHFAGTLVGLLPDSEAIRRDGRAALAEALTVRTVRHLAESELDILEEGLELLIERNADLQSAAVRRSDGYELIRVGEHDGNWNSAGRSYSTNNQLTVPIMEGGRRWGQLELRFEPLRRAGWRGFIDGPLTRYSFYLAVLGFIALYFVLGKMLKHLDPSKAVPARVRSALDTMMEGLIAIDLKGQVVLSNQAFSAVAGKTPEALLGVRINNLPWRKVVEMPDTDADTAFPWEVTLREGRPCTSAPIHFVDGDSKIRTFLVNCSPVMGGEGQHVGVLVGLGDVTELEEKEIELRLSRDRAEAANRAKSEFLANMSHEIRTPMNAILGFTEMLKRGYARSEDDNRKYLNTIHSSGKFLLELINDLLDLSKIEAGSLELERVHCPVQDIAREVVNVLSVKAAQRGVSLELEVNSPIPATIHTDPLRLRQIITNLVGNAIKFTEQGSVRVGLRYDPEAAPQMIAFDIIDTGIGMSAEQIEKIFDPFVQADKSITRRFGGTGLGLSISRRFAEALGGSIEVKSTPGVGSVFTVLIDVGSLDGVAMLTQEEALREAVTPAEKIRKAWSFAQARVLVADDNKQNRDLLRLVLGEHGLRVTEAENGQEAVAAARAENFDVVLMDLEMPLMDGVAATRALRADGMDLPILALTAHALQAVEKTIESAGFSEYISKPIDIDALIERLAKLLNATPKDQVDIVQPSDAGPIRSRLPVQDPRYRTIVVDFVNELEPRLEAMQRAREDLDLEKLAKLAYSLKGLGCTVGFDEFTQPSRTLETAAGTGDLDEIDQCLSTIRILAGRVDVDAGDQVPEALVPLSVHDAPVLDGSPIRSRLPVDDPRYRAIVVDFIDELESRLAAMEQALSESDCNTLASLAHALVGVAGGVGFDEFTEPTRLLETAARAGDQRAAGTSITVLRGLAGRVETPKPHADLQVSIA